MYLHSENGILNEILMQAVAEYLLCGMSVHGIPYSLDVFNLLPILIMVNAILPTKLIFLDEKRKAVRMFSAQIESFYLIYVYYPTGINGG